MKRIFIYKYSLCKDIGIGINKNNEFCIIDKKSKMVKLIFSDYDESLIQFFAELTEGYLYSLEDASEEFGINPRIIDFLKSNDMLIKRMAITIDISFLKDIRIKNFKFLLNSLYLPVFIFGLLISRKYFYLFYYNLTFKEAFLAVTSSLLFHEIAHVLMTNDCKTGKVNKVAYIPPLTLATFISSIEDFNDDIDITSAGIKAQLLYSGLISIVSCITGYTSLMNISMINMIIAVNNTMPFSFGVFNTDGYNIIQLIYNRHRKNDTSFILKNISNITKYSLAAINFLVLYMIMEVLL